jgi:hypothetical protein
MTSCSPEIQASGFNQKKRKKQEKKAPSELTSEAKQPKQEQQ